VSKREKTETNQNVDRNSEKSVKMSRYREKIGTIQKKKAKYREIWRDTVRKNTIQNWNQKYSVEREIEKELFLYRTMHEYIWGKKYNNTKYFSWTW
jgi:hypothetical protein